LETLLDNLDFYTFDVPDVYYGQKHVLRAHALKIKKNSWTAIVGKSGSGKTTLFKSLLSILQERMRQDPLSDKVAYMPQTDLLLPWINILTNVTLGARLRGEGPNIEKARELLNEVGLGKEVLSYPHQLSIGMRQRAALVRTIMEDCDLVLLDEPFSALDVATKHIVYSMIKKNLANKTVIIISHDNSDISMLADQKFNLEGESGALLKFVDF